MATANDFWTLRSEINVAKESLNSCRQSMLIDKAYTKKYAQQKQIVMGLEQDLESVVRDLMASGEITLDIRMAIKEVAKLPVADETELAAYWNTSTVPEREEMLYKVGIRKSVVDSMNISGNWPTLREGIRMKLMELIP
jgi:hypothetical protein